MTLLSTCFGVLAMLSEVFGHLEIDDAKSVSACAQFCTPSEYSVVIHNAGWFLRQQASDEEPEQKRELINHRAAYFHYHRDFKNAVEEYKVLLNQYRHSRAYSVTVYDSLIRCALMVPSHDVDELLRYLREYKRCVLDYGDQVQYLTVAKDVYAHTNCDDASRKFVDVVCLLCETTDLPEHWLAFGERKLPSMGRNFHIGYITRATMLLERQIKSAHGFVITVLERKLRSCVDRLSEMGCSEELIREARLNMGVDLISVEEKVALCDNFSRPAHDCRSRVDFSMNEDDLEASLEEFKKKYIWMFEGCLIGNKDGF